MISYAAREIFTTQEQNLLALASLLVERVKHHLVKGEEVRCHELARAVARCLWGRASEHHVADGWYGMVEHTWLWTKPREPFSAPPNILDVYSVGRLPMVELVNSSVILPYEYRRGDPRKDINQSVVRKLVTEMKVSASSRAKSKTREHQTARSGK